jgi:Abortive infection C-terminus
MHGMNRLDIKGLVNKYIGVSGGYLGDFTYRTHEEFSPEFCNLDINPFDIEGTTRVRFEKILETSSPDVQAKIVRGILKKYPPTPDNPLRTQKTHDDFLRLAQRLEAGSSVETPTPAITSTVVEHALADAESLIHSRGATSGVDRIHTALHGYLRAVCDKAGIPCQKDATMVALFKFIREHHPGFMTPGPRSQDIGQIMKAMNSIMDVLNPIRNNASPAHPNDELLEAPEAMLVINATRTILHYLDAKLAVIESALG